MAKLYCYVDESGQDAGSEVFVVVAVVMANNREELRRNILKAETTSKKGARKWHSSGARRREAFLNLVLKNGVGKRQVFVGSYEKPIPYFFPLIETVEKSLKRFRKGGNFEMRLYIDGFDKKKCKEMTNALRAIGIRMPLVKGVRDESEPIIRLADMWAGCLRKAYQSQKHCFETAAREKALKNRYFEEVSVIRKR